MQGPYDRKPCARTLAYIRRPSNLPFHGRPRMAGCVMASSDLCVHRRVVSPLGASLLEIWLSRPPSRWSWRSHDAARPRRAAMRATGPVRNSHVPVPCLLAGAVLTFFYGALRDG